MSFAPVTSPPSYDSLTPAQKRAADAVAQLPSLVRLQAMLEGSIAQSQLKIDQARAAGHEPSGALLTLLSQSRARAATLRTQLDTIQNQVRDAVRDAVYRGWITYQQAIDAGIFRAPEGGQLSGLGIAPVIIIVAAAVVLLLPISIVTAINEYKAGAVQAQNQAAAAAATTQAWWTSLGFTGSPTDANAPTPGLQPGATLPNPGTVTSTSPSNNLPGTTLDRIMKQGGTVLIVGGAIVAGLFVLPHVIRGFRNG